MHCPFVVMVPVQREADLPAGSVLCADSNCAKQSLWYLSWRWVLKAVSKCAHSASRPQQSAMVRGRMEHSGFALSAGIHTRAIWFPVVITNMRVCCRWHQLNVKYTICGNSRRIRTNLTTVDTLNYFTDGRYAYVMLSRFLIKACIVKWIAYLLNSYNYFRNIYNRASKLRTKIFSWTTNLNCVQIWMLLLDYFH